MHKALTQAMPTHQPCLSPALHAQINARTSSHINIRVYRGITSSAQPHHPNHVFSAISTRRPCLPKHKNGILLHLIAGAVILLTALDARVKVPVSALSGTRLLSSCSIVLEFCCVIAFHRPSVLPVIQEVFTYFPISHASPPNYTQRKI
ncbi:hypothetical protein K458DRAFT_411375 [Lentithecium fluviatile CBS 122367]|uniref:Uncharacterized protein n=1 Tax=Lentithecium fluviatile CBS 122367 TaxID=1168545 RepID=A0A6G1JM83_9PLEO|nr:hypothetical protein K458DRAFT_411375 [Lentithecium fluviatile CBS 122367]